MCGKQKYGQVFRVNLYHLSCCLIHRDNADRLLGLPKDAIVNAGHRGRKSESILNFCYAELGIQYA